MYVQESALIPESGTVSSMQDVVTPKDVSALLQTAQENDAPLQLLKTVQQVNELQKERLFQKFKAYYNGNIQGYRVAIWGLAFKPETDDIREAPALQLIKRLQKAQCAITVYDPVAMPNTQKLMGNTVRYATDLYDAVKDAQVLFHVTEWKEFRMPDWRRIRHLMHTPLLIDGRNVFDKNALDGFTYLQIGR